MTHEEIIEECLGWVEEYDLEWDTDLLHSFQEQLEEGRVLSDRQDTALTNIHGGLGKMVGHAMRQRR